MSKEDEKQATFILPDGETSDGKSRFRVSLDSIISKTPLGTYRFLRNDGHTEEIVVTAEGFTRRVLPS